MNPFKKLASQTAIYGLPTIIGRMLNYFLVPLYTYKFSRGEFGIVTEMYAYVSFLIIILTYGMETALFRFSQTQEDIPEVVEFPKGNETYLRLMPEGAVSDFRKPGLLRHKEKVYSTSLVSLLFSTVTFVITVSLFALPIAKVLNYANHYEYVIWFALIIGLDALSAIPFAKLREQNKAKRFALIKSVNIGVNILLNVFFIGFCKTVYDSHQGVFYNLVEKIYNPHIGIGYIFIANLIASAITILLLTPEIFFKVKYVFDFDLWKKMLLYALPLMVAGLAGMVNETMDRVLLKYLLPQEMEPMVQLGIYGACYKISILMTIFIQTYKFAAEPFFFSHSRDKDSKQLYADVMKYFVIACSLIFMGTMANMEIIKYFVAKEYRVGLPVVPILLLANLFLGVFFNLSIWFKLSGQTKFGIYLSVFGALITLVLNFYWIPKIGYMGSAWATLVCYSSMMIVSYLIGQKHYPIRYDLKRILGYLSLSLTLYFVSTYINTSSPILNLIFGNLLLLILAAVIYYKERITMK